MPYFTLHRNYILRTTKGHSIAFTKGAKAWVPPICVPDAVAIGAVPEDESIDVLPAELAPKPELPADERKTRILAAIETLVARNERGDFTAAGMPHCKKLESLCGFEVYNRERDDVWMAYTKAKAEAAELQ